MAELLATATDAPRSDILGALAAASVSGPAPRPTTTAAVAGDPVDGRAFCTSFEADLEPFQEPDLLNERRNMANLVLFRRRCVCKWRVWLWRRHPLNSRRCGA